MVRGYQRIQPLVFPLDAAELPARSWYQLHLPMAWIGAIKAAVLAGSSRKWVSVRHRSLDATLKATLPTLIHLNSDVWNYPGGPWLLAEEPVDPVIVTAIVVSWLRTEYPQLLLLAAVLQQLQPEQLQWQRASIELGAKGPSGNDYHLAPHLVAHELCQDGVEARLMTTALQWHRVAAPGRGAEVISWPPLERREGNGRTWYYSYLLTFTLQTLPQDSRGYLHMDVGIRRWATRRSPKGQVALPRNGDRTSVYMRAPASWLTDGGRRSFCIAPAGWLPPVDGRFDMGWKDHVPAVLADAQHRELPQFMGIAEDPERYLQSGGPVEAAVVFGHWKGHKHGVTTGASPADRMQLFKHVRLTVPWLTPAPELNKEPARRGRPSAVEGDERSAALHAAFGPEVRVEIWYQQEHVLPRLKEALKAQLKASEVGDCRLRTSYGEIKLDVRTLPDRFTAELPSGDHADTRTEALKRASEIRDYVLEQTAVVSSPVLSLVQILDQKGEKYDAKPAIRSGFAQARRLAQCFFGLDARATEPGLVGKYAKTILDLLRQTGRLPAPVENDSMSPGLSLMGLWLVKRNRSNRSGPACFPVAVRLRIDSPVVEATLYGSSEWLPYPLALLKLAREGGGVVGAREALGWMQGLVMNAVASGPTLLMVEAQNARATWKWLGNQRMTSDRLCWDSACEGPFIRPEQYQGLRVVRLRSNDQNETPQWYAVSGDRPGRTHGLFEISERLMHSIAEKADTMRGLVGKTKPEAPSVQTVTPAMVELAYPFLQSGDQVRDWAWLVHGLRSAHSHHDDATVLPLPLHLAALMEQYLVPGGSDVQS